MIGDKEITIPKQEPLQFPQAIIDIEVRGLIQRHGLIPLLESLSDVIGAESVTISAETAEIARTFVELAAEEIAAS